MAALHGREDALLDPERFGRFLRQANDAEYADVRKLTDDTFEVAHHKTDLGMARNLGPQGTSSAVHPEGNGAGAAPAPSSGAALRFRRGSRSPIRPLELPLIGMVQVDD